MIEVNEFICELGNTDLMNFVLAVNNIECKSKRLVENIKISSQTKVKMALTEVRNSIIHAMNMAIALSYTDDREIGEQIFYNFSGNRALVNYPRIILDNLVAGKYEEAESLSSSLCGSNCWGQTHRAKLQDIILKRLEAQKQPGTMIRDEDNVNEQVD